MAAALAAILNCNDKGHTVGVSGEQQEALLDEDTEEGNHHTSPRPPTYGLFFFISVMLTLFNRQE